MGLEGAFLPSSRSSIASGRGPHFEDHCSDASSSLTLKSTKDSRKQLGFTGCLTIL